MFISPSAAASIATHNRPEIKKKIVIGATIGATMGLVLVAIILFCILRARKRKNRRTAHPVGIEVVSEGTAPITAESVPVSHSTGEPVDRMYMDAVLYLFMDCAVTAGILGPRIAYFGLKPCCRMSSQCPTCGSSHSDMMRTSSILWAALL